MHTTTINRTPTIIDLLNDAREIVDKLQTANATRAMGFEETARGMLAVASEQVVRLEEKLIAAARDGE